MQMEDRQRPQGRPELFDEEDSEDGDMLRAQERVVGLMEYRAHYYGSVHPPDVDDRGTLPAGFRPIMIGGMVCYTNGKDKTDTTWYSDGSKQNNKAGVGIKCGQLEIIARVTGPQTSYRAELQGAAVVSCLADQDDELVIDNKAVVDYGATTPHRECSDVDLRRVIETHQRNKQLRWRWIPSHRVIKRYHTEKEKKDIRHNDVVDRLAKLAAKLPLPEAPLGTVDSINICNGVTPTPAKKWIIEYRNEVRWARTHWTSWLPIRGTRRMTWITWLWGNVRWQGTGAPWERCKKECPLCGCTHGTTIHNRLIQCPVWEPEFRKMWTNSRGDWAIQMEDWYNKATPEDKHPISKLQIPESLIETLQPGQKRNLRRQVAEHQYLAMIGMTQLRGTLPMLPKDPTCEEGNAGSAWYGALRARKVSSNVTEKNLQEQVHYRPPKRTTRGVKVDKQCKDATAPLRQMHNKVQVYVAGDLTRKKRRQLLDILGSPIMQTTRADDLRVQICQRLQRWSMLYGPGNHMPIGGYKITKTTIEGVEMDARNVLATRYKVGVAMHNMAKWMQYALKWRDYYQQQKKKMYHQESKGIVRQVFRKWYRQGQVHMRNYNTHNVMSPQPAWDAWEEQARRLWHQSTKKIMECTYRRVKDEVRQYTRKLLAGHEWAVAILHADAMNANRKGRLGDNEAGTDGNKAPKRRKIEQDSVS